jgi:hypothetical protein
MPKVIRQTIAPHPFTKEELSKNHWNTLSVQLKNEVVIVRYLTSKIVHTSEIVTPEEIAILFLAFEEVVKKSSSDALYRQKNLLEVFNFRAVYQSLNEIQKMDPSDRFKKLSAMYAFSRGPYFTARYFYSVRGQLIRQYDIRIRVRFPKKFAPKSFIGKGYGDNGTAKEPAFDACHSWQEVASAQEYNEDSETRFDRETKLFREFQIHTLQQIT